jgi:5-hydroxyisourate hydrolase
MSKPTGVTTHVLNTAEGLPGIGITIELWRLDPDPVLVTTAVTNDDGRTDAPLLDAASYATGVYELRFHIGAYFAGRGIASPYLEVVPVRVTFAEPGGHYHVPLLCSPFGYTTYRGS